MSTRSPRILAGVLAAVALAAGIVAWWSMSDTRTRSADAGAEPVIAIAAAAVDPANEGRRVRIEGRLASAGVAVDPELGISSDAALVLREVEMYQWQERCIADACAHEAAWSSNLIDSSRFQEGAAHGNPPTLPFASSRFAAPSPRIGAFIVDPALLATLPSLPRPVSAGELAPNLAASFRNVDGALFSGEDPARPAIGDLRVRYHIVANGPVVLTGVQRGDHLVAVESDH